MKKNDLKSIFRHDLGSVLLIVFGGILLFNPDFGSAAISAILGWGLVGLGAAGLLVGIFSKPQLSSSAITVCALILLLGIYLLKNPLALAKVLGYALGIILCKQGLDNWMEAKQVQKAGGPFRFSLFFSCAMIIVGIRLILSPMSTSRLVMTVGGAFLIACGIGNIVNHHRVIRYIEERDYDPNIIDADQ